MSVTSRAGQVSMGIRLNRFKEAYTWVLANETTPIVISLKNCSSHNFFGLLTDILTTSGFRWRFHFRNGTIIAV